jgi:hypothetical protein
LSGGDHCWFKRSTRKKRPVTRHPHGIIIIIIIKTTDKCYKQCMKREMLKCCGIKQYTQTEKLQQIGQI